MTYEQLFICRLSNLPPSIVSIVLRKLAIVNTHRNVSKVVHSELLLTYEQSLICYRRNLPASVVSIVLRKLAMADSATDQSLDT